MEQALERRLHDVFAELCPEDMHAVVAFAEFLRHRHQAKEPGKADAEISKVEHVQILSDLDAVAEMSAVTGPPVSNRDHDRSLYGGKWRPFFADTGARFACIVHRDSDYEAAVRWMQQNRQPLATPDYVLDELLTLLTVGDSYCLALATGERLWQQRVERVTIGICSVSLAFNAISKTVSPRLFEG
jgi:hypothetical protein